VSRTSAVVAAAAVLLVIAVALFINLRRPPLSDEERVKQLFLDAAYAVNTKNAAALMRLVSDDYNDGTFTKRELRRLAIEGLRSSGRIIVVPSLRSLQIRGGWAHAELEVDVQTEGYDVAPQHLSLSVDLARRGRDWKIIRATGWENAALQGDWEGW